MEEIVFYIFLTAITGVTLGIYCKRGPSYAVFFSTIALCACCIICVNRVANTYRTLEEKGVIPDTTITVKNGVNDTIITFKLNQ